MVAEAKDVKATQVIRRWLREATEGRKEVNLPELKELVIDRLLADQATLRAFLREQLAGVVYDFVQRYCGKTRRHIVFADELIERGAAGDKAVSRPKWSRWLAWAGDRHVRFAKMSKADLLASAEIDKGQGENVYLRGVLKETLAAGMADGQMVEDVYTNGQIDEIAASLYVRVRVYRRDVTPEQLATALRARRQRSAPAAQQEQAAD